VLPREVPPLRKDRLGRLWPARRRRHARGATGSKVHLRGGFRAQAETQRHQYPVSPLPTGRRTDMTTTEIPAPVTNMPRIGDPAPAFTAQTTQGEINFPADYAGKWVIFFSHPADFTPVCTSEFMTFVSMREQFLRLPNRTRRPVGRRALQPYRLAADHQGQDLLPRHEGRRGHVPADRGCLDGDRPQVRHGHAG